MSSKKKIKNELPFQIIGLEVVESCFVDNHEAEIENVEFLTQDKFAFLISLTHQADVNNDILVVKPKITIKNEKTNVEYASFVTKCLFSFKDLKKYLNKNQLDIPQNYIDRLSSIAISSSRGIVFSELKSTYLKNAIIPIIDVSFFTYEKMKL